MKIIVNSAQFQIESTEDDPWGVVNAPIQCEFERGALVVKGSHSHGFMPPVHANLDVSVQSFVEAIQFAIDCPHCPHITRPIWPPVRATVQETLLQILQYSQSPEAPGAKPFELNLRNGGSVPLEWTTVNLTQNALIAARTYVEKQRATFAVLAHGRNDASP